MGNEVQLWLEEEGREGLVPLAVRTAVRMETIKSFTELVEVLRPYCTGMMGEISPKLTELYMGALRQRALLAGAYSHAPVREPVVEPEVVESTAVDGRVLAAKVIKQLEELELDMRKKGTY